MNSRAMAIAADGLHKRYAGGVEGAGLNGFDLHVEAGTVCGLLGPNGAGKTTAIKILTTLLTADSGEAWVGGFNIRTQGEQVRRSIGLVGQYAAVDEILTGRQNLVMFGQLYHLSGRQARIRAGDLLEQFSLAEAADLAVNRYSGGMRRRLDLAVSLIASPPILFVDEPTTGLDPLGRREVWAAIRERVAGGTTVLLTTQYLEEADQLADWILMLKAGRVIAEGSPDSLKKRLGGDWLDITLEPAADVETVRRIVQAVASGEVRLDADAARVSVPVEHRTRALVTVATALSEARIEPRDIAVRRPTLDEVFIHLTAAPDINPKVEVVS